MAQLSAQREELVKKLAEARGVTEQAEKERQEQIAAEKKAREEAAAQAALKAAEEKAKREAAAQAARSRAQSSQSASRPQASRAQTRSQATRAQARTQSQSRSSAPQVSVNATGSRAAVIAYAKRFLGVPYVWGGSTPSGFDCSGLTSYVYRNAVGVNLPRVSQAQRNVGTRVSRAQAQPGDMVNYSHHVGIYLGNGYMIHAPKPGDRVKIARVYGNPVYVRVL